MRNASPFRQRGADFGMLSVLLLLCVVFSIATIESRYPSGKIAGEQVAHQISKKQGAGARVLIIAGTAAQERAFSRAAVTSLEDSGAVILAVVHGDPRDANLAITKLIANAQEIDAVALSDVTALWSVLDRFPELDLHKRISPQSSYWPGFLTINNLLGIANASAIYAIIAIGMTMVIITAGIDLSVGSIVALGSVTSAIVIRDVGSGAESGLGIVLLAIVAGIAMGAAAGLFNGAMVAWVGIPSFIVTLGVMKIASGMAYRLADGNSISDLPTSIRWLGGERSLWIPNSVWLMAILFIVAHVIMTRTVFGRYVYAIGGNEQAARLSGVPVRYVKTMVYVICGALAGLGGILLTSKLDAGSPKYGTGYELDVIAAVVVGGTSLMGGRGTIFGTLVGALIIAVIRNGMNLTKIDTYNQWIVLGAVLLLAVVIDTLKRRHAARVQL